MKTMFTILTALLVPLSVYGRVDTSQCPSEIAVEIQSVEKAELNDVIENDLLLKLAWERMQPTELYSETFKLLTRSEATLCVYVGSGKVAYLQTNNFVDELMVTFDQNQTTYFRLPVKSFSPEHIDFVQNDLNLLAAVYIFGGDSITQIGEEKIGQAKSVKAHVKP